MKSIVKVMVCVCVCAVFGGGSDALGASFTGMTVFGDSLSDTGNISTLTVGAFPPNPPYFNGRFSNGPVWVERLAASLGLPAVMPSFLGGSNYAVGGAESGLGHSLAVPSPAPETNIGAQIGGYLATHTPTADELFVVWGGANDFLIAGQPDPTIPASNIVGGIEALALAGARHILVPNLPLLGQTPVALGSTGTDPSSFTPAFAGGLTSAGLDALVGGFNTALGVGLDNLENATLPGLGVGGVKIYRLDILSGSLKNPRLA